MRTNGYLGTAVAGDFELAVTASPDVEDGVTDDDWLRHIRVAVGIASISFVADTADAHHVAGAFRQAAAELELWASERSERAVRAAAVDGAVA